MTFRFRGLFLGLNRLLHGGRGRFRSFVIAIDAEGTVRLLVERGARLELKDTIWQGTLQGWASHGGKTQVADYLRDQMEQIVKHQEADVAARL